MLRSNPASLLISLALHTLTVQASTPTTPLDDLIRATNRSLGHLLSERRWEEALVVLQEKTRSGEHDRASIRDLVTVLTHLGRRPEAIRLLQREARRERSKQGWARGRLRALERAFLTQHAAKEYARGVELLRGDQAAEAFAILRGLVQQEPGNLAVYVSLAQAEVALGRDGALETIQQGTELFGESADLLLLEGEAYLRTGAPSRALGSLLKAQAQLPSSEAVAIGIAKAHRALGSERLGASHLREHLKLYPGHLEAAVILVEWKEMSEERLGTITDAAIDHYLAAAPQTEGDLRVTRSREAIRASLDRRLAVKTPS